MNEVSKLLDLEFGPSLMKRTVVVPGKTRGGAGVGTAIGTPTLPLPLFSLLLLRLLG